MPLIWPASLPKIPLMDGFKRQLADNTLRRRPDAGPPLVRRRTTTNPGTQQVQFVLDDAQLLIFERFYGEETVGGTFSFTMYDPVFRRESRMQIVPPVEIAPIGDSKNWFVSFQLEILV